MAGLQTCKIEIKLLASSQDEPTPMSYISHLETYVKTLEHQLSELLEIFFFNREV